MATDTRIWRGVALLATLSIAAAGCTGRGSDPARQTRAVAPASQASALPAPTATAAPAELPLVLAVHPTRAPANLTLADARALLAGEVASWSDLGAGDGPVRLVTGPAITGAPPEAAVDSDASALAEVAADRLAVAAVPASAVGPSVRVLTVGGRHPLRDPGRYPLTVSVAGPTAAPVPPSASVTTVSIVGDIMLGRRVGRSLAARADFAAALRPTARRLAAADITAGNLESTLSRAGAPRQGDDSFAADPRVLPGLRAAGFDVLSLANNHTGDFGPQALIDTVERVAGAGIMPVGAGRNGGQARRPVVVERDGVRFGFLAFNAIGETPAATAERPGAIRIRMQPRTGPLNPDDLAAMAARIERLRASADVVIVLPHWGQQYTNRPVADQRRVAHALVDAGADLVVGSHPHWVQGAELYRGKLIAYSLGNFVFDMDFSRQTVEGAILQLVFWGDQLKAAEVVPVRIGGDFAPRVVGGSAAAAILDRMWQTSGPPFRSASATAPR